MFKRISLIICLVLAACGGDNNSQTNNGKTNNGINNGNNGGTNNGVKNNGSNNNGQNNGSQNNTNQNNTTQSNNGNTNTNPGDYERIILRGADYFGSSEKFNAYYTDPNWSPKQVIFVDMENGSTDFGSQTYETPVDMNTATSNMEAGDLVFVKTTGGAVSNVNIRIDEDRDGTYDLPIVFYGERNADGSLGVHFKCQTNGSNARSSCFNLEFSDYIAIDGFIMEGGNYGVRTVGSYDTAGHQVGIAMLNNRVFDQQKDPLFSGGSDWLVVESNTCYGAKDGDGHGIYLSNGSDWNIVRYNEIYDNDSSDFQVNADPISTCEEQGIDYSDIVCHGSANDGNGHGVSEFFTIANNFFHDGNSQGPNFTSMRNSKVMHNIIGPYVRHSVSFWQETPEAKLGSSNNEVSNNLFVGHRSHLLQFVNNSGENTISNNILLGLTDDGSAVDTGIQVIETDASTASNTYMNNFYFTGMDLGHTLHASETHSDQLPADLFEMAPYARTGHPEDWTPKEGELDGWKPPMMLTFPSPYSR